MHRENIDLYYTINWEINRIISLFVLFFFVSKVSLYISERLKQAGKELDSTKNHIDEDINNTIARLNNAGWTLINSQWLEMCAKKFFFAVSSSILLIISWPKLEYITNITNIKVILMICCFTAIRDQFGLQCNSIAMHTAGCTAMLYKIWLYSRYVVITLIFFFLVADTLDQTFHELHGDACSDRFPRMLLHSFNITSLRTLTLLIMCKAKNLTFLAHNADTSQCQRINPSAKLFKDNVNKTLNNRFSFHSKTVWPLFDWHRRDFFLDIILQMK